MGMTRFGFSPKTSPLPYGRPLSCPNGRLRSVVWSAGKAFGFVWATFPYVGKITPYIIRILGKKSIYYTPMVNKNYHPKTVE